MMAIVVKYLGIYGLDVISTHISILQHLGLHYCIQYQVQCCSYLRYH